MGAIIFFLLLNVKSLKALREEALLSLVPFFSEKGVILDDN